MEHIFIYILLVSGIFNIIITFITNTKNFISALILKIIPFFFGLSNIIFALYLLNIITIK